MIRHASRLGMIFCRSCIIAPDHYCKREVLSDSQSRNSRLQAAMALKVISGTWYELFLTMTSLIFIEIGAGDQDDLTFLRGFKLVIPHIDRFEPWNDFSAGDKPFLHEVTRNFTRLRRRLPLLHCISIKSDMTLNALTRLFIIFELSGMLVQNCRKPSLTIFCCARKHVFTRINVSEKYLAGPIFIESKL